MKTGVIIYATGNPPNDWSEEREKEACEFTDQGDLVRIITRVTGHFDVLDAWFELTSKGRSLIICKLASFDEEGKMRLTGRELRLCG